MRALALQAFLIIFFSPAMAQAQNAGSRHSTSQDPDGRQRRADRQITASRPPEPLLAAGRGDAHLPFGFHTGDLSELQSSSYSTSWLPSGQERPLLQGLQHLKCNASRRRPLAALATIQLHYERRVCVKTR